VSFESRPLKQYVEDEKALAKLSPRLDVLAAAMLGTPSAIAGKEIVKDMQRSNARVALYEAILNNGAEYVGEIYSQLATGKVDPEIVERFVRASGIGNRQERQAIATGYPALKDLLSQN
jgi:hypothetical protein